jgi:hypothetical protein
VVAAHPRRGVGTVDPHETARIVARDLVPVVAELASLKGEVYRDLERHHTHDYRALALRLEAAHAAAEAALVETRRRVRLGGER